MSVVGQRNQVPGHLRCGRVGGWGWVGVVMRERSEVGFSVW